MAPFNFDQTRHQIHAFFHRRKFGGLIFAVGIGAAIGSMIFGASLYQVLNGIHGERDTALTRFSQTEKSIAALRKERAEQVAAAERSVISPQATHQTFLNVGSFSEDDIDYWRKQMDAFSRMSGVQLAIVGRGQSNYKNATKLNVSISLSSKGAQGGLSTLDLVKALDFLQLYGYVESFNGSEAIVHVSESTIS